MRRRQLLLSLAAMVLLGVGGVVLFLWLTTPAPGVTWDNFRRLRAGMSSKKVASLLGERGDVTHQFDGTLQRVWHSEEVTIYLNFDPTDQLLTGTAIPRGMMASHYPREEVPTDEGFLDHMRQLLPW
jgi:hypothetical protein